MARLGPPIFLGVFTVIAIVFLTGGASDDGIFKETFQIDAVYRDSGHVEISFSDKSAKTTSTVLEVLGMSESFQKTFYGSEWTETVEFSGEPRHGWSVHPIVLEIDHGEFGRVQLKTEIHPEGEPAPPVIYHSP